jgi:aminotransferase
MKINVFQPKLGLSELNAIRKVFKSKWLGKGPVTNQFESKWAEHISTSSENVLTTNSCSEALFSSLKIFELNPNDEVIIPTISFIGAANAVLSHGCKLVLCDVDPRSLNVRLSDIKKVFTNKTKAIIVLHYGGIPCDIEEIADFCRLNNVYLIEDAAAAVYSKLNNKFLGTFGDMGMWSFDAMKILVTGDGSAMFFKDSARREKAALLMYFGLVTKSGYENTVAQKWWEFEIIDSGHRAIMNDITSSIGLVQLRKLDKNIKIRKRVHNYYCDNLKDFKWIELPPRIEDNVQSSYYFFHIQVSSNLRDRLADFLRINGVYTTFRYFPLHKVSYFNVTNQFPNADFAAESTLLLPIHQSLSTRNLKHIIDLIRKFDFLIQKI